MNKSKQFETSTPSNIIQHYYTIADHAHGISLVSLVEFFVSFLTLNTVLVAFMVQKGGKQLKMINFADINRISSILGSICLQKTTE